MMQGTPFAALAFLLCVLLAQRGLELLHARRTARTLEARGATRVRPDGMAGIVTVHATFFGASFVEAVWPGATWTGLGWWTWVGAAGFIAGQALRAWSIRTLGDRWNTRVYVLPQPLVASGPYRWLRHPNYVGVVLELLGLQVAFGLWMSAIAVTVLHAIALRRRITIEAAALARA